MPKLRCRKKQRRKILFIDVEAVTLPARWKPIHPCWRCLAAGDHNVAFSEGPEGQALSRK